MLIWINGAYGVGKTQTAHELHRRLTASHVADPELLGFAMHKMLPPSRRDDFQDLPQWRTAVTQTLIDAERSSDSPVIVPMTLVDTDYFEEIIDGLISHAVEIRHYALTAPVHVIHRRLRARLAHRVGRVIRADETWAMQQTDRCVTALRSERFATHVPTDGRTVSEVVEDIAEDAGLELCRSRMSVTRYQLRRVAVGIRHIRL